MSTITLLPSITVLNDNVDLVDAATLHEALSDSDDASYGAWADTSDKGTVYMTTGAVPAGALRKSAQLVVRLAKTSGSTPKVTFTLVREATTVFGPASLFPTWTEQLDTSLAYLTTSALGAVDDYQLTIENPASGTVGIIASEAKILLTYVARPTTTVTVGGTITDTNLPAVSWANTLDSDGGAQTKYRVRLYTEAQYTDPSFNPNSEAPTPPFEDSGIVSSAAASWTPTRPQPDGTYRAYVAVAQTVNGTDHWSDLTWPHYDEYTVDVLLPAVPLLDATVEEPYGRIRLDITEQTGDATTDMLELQRSYDAGLTWTPVRTVLADGGVDPASPTAWDYEAPNGDTAMYRARALHDHSGVWAASDWAETDAEWASAWWWLKHPTQPSMNVPVVVHAQPSEQRAPRQAAFQPLGATYPLVVSDTRGPASGVITLRVDTRTEKELLDALLDTTDALLLQGPNGNHWPDRWVVLSQHDRARLIDKAWIEATLDDIAWTNVDRPTGLVAAWPDEDDLYPADTTVPGFDITP